MLSLPLHMLGARVSAALQAAESGREADAKGQGIHNSVGRLPGAGSILPGDDLAGPDRKVVPVAQAAHIDAIDLHIPHRFQDLRPIEAVVRKAETRGSL